MTNAALEARLAQLCRRYDAIESGLQQLQKQMQARAARPAAAAAAARGSSSLTAAAGAKKVVDPTTLTHLQPHKEDTPEVAALRAWCLANKLYSAEFKWVPSDYYSQSLQWRRDILEAATIQHLCKTIVLENTRCAKEDCSDRNNSRYYMIVYQYVNRFDSELVMRLIRDLNTGLGKRQFNFRLADPEKSKELTGFDHGAVAPFGTKTPIPVILCSRAAEVTPAHLWMGGGHVDCKCRVDLAEFMERLDPIVASISVPMTPEELEQIVD